MNTVCCKGCDAPVTALIRFRATMAASIHWWPTCDAHYIWATEVAKREGRGDYTVHRVIAFPVGSEGWFALERAFALLAEAGADYTTSAGVTVRGWWHEKHGTPGNPHVWLPYEHGLRQALDPLERCPCGLVSNDMGARTGQAA